MKARVQLCFGIAFPCFFSVSRDEADAVELTCSPETDLALSVDPVKALPVLGEIVSILLEGFWSCGAGMGRRCAI